MLTVNVPKLSRPPPVVAAGIASRDRQSRDVHGLDTINRKDPEGGSGGIPLHGRGARSKTCYGDVPAQVRQDAFQGDRAGCHDVDDITVTGSSLIGRRDCLPQSATSQSGQRADRDGDHGGNRTLFQLLQGQASKGVVAGLRGGRAGTGDDRSMRKTAGRSSWNGTWEAPPMVGVQCQSALVADHRRGLDPGFPGVAVHTPKYERCTFPELSASCDSAHEALNEPADFWAQAPY